MQTKFTEKQLQDPAIANSDGVIRKCVHCGFCTATCPTYALLGDENDSPRGRIYLMRNMLETDATPSKDVVKHIDRCLSCLSCMTTCPAGVNYMHLVDHARTYIEQRYKRPLADRFWRWLLASVLPHPSRMRLALAMAPLGRPLAPLLDRVRSLKPAAALLTLAPRRSAKRLELDPAPLQVPAPKGRVILLRGCAESVLAPHIREATERVLARAGFSLADAPGEACCGGLVHHMGREADALASARRNVDSWCAADDETPLAAILTTVSGCGVTMKNYGFMLRHDPKYAKRAERMSSLVCDISELLEREGLPPTVAVDAPSVAYHAACSLQHGQQVRHAPKALLKAAGFDVRDVPDGHFCCGSAGVYNILQSDIATQLRTRKLDAISRTGAGIIATGNIGCMMQLQGDRPIVHTIELLDWATGGRKPHALTEKGKRHEACWT